MQIKINGTDWSSYIDPYSVHPYHEKRQGPAKGITMGGSEIMDTVAVKSCFDAMVGLIDQSRYIALVELAKQDYVTVIYTDPDTDTSATRVMMLTAGKPTQVPLLCGGYMYKNISLNFRER